MVFRTMSRKTLVVFFIVSIFFGPATAQQFPQRTVRFIVGYSPGGSIDMLARAIAQELSKKWTAGVVVENRTGADSIIAATAVAQAAPDGYILFIASNALAITASQNNLGYDPITSFTPIILTASVPNVLLVNASTTSVNSLQDIVRLAKAKPGSLNFGSPGSSSPAHLEMMLLEQQAGIELTNIGYKGVTPVLTDLLSGSIDVTFASISSSISLIESGKLKALAVSTIRRSPLLPNVPTVAEALNSQFDEAGTWVGLMAPAGTPDAIVSQIRSEVAAILKEPQLVPLLEKQGYLLISKGSEEFKDFLKSEIDKSARLMKAEKK
jgi:tripartite-type tricarboxylate transporter receptor subunit TctC